MKQFILFCLFIQLEYASSYTLNAVLKSADAHNNISKAINQESLALKAKNRADVASEPLELFGEGTKAYPQEGRNGNEYTVGISKKIILNNIQKQEQKIMHLSNQAYILEKEKNLLSFRNGLKNIYHQHCLEKQNYKSFQQSYEEFVKLYKKKEKAYKYQEISKTELMQLEIEKNRLYAQLQELKMHKDISKQNLFMLTKIDNRSSAGLLCNDMYPIKANLKLDDTFSLSKEAYAKRLQSSHEKVRRYSNSLDEITLSTQYSEEIDIKKYSIGVSIPLSFTSKKSEYERAAAMYQNSSISFQHEQMMLEKRSLLFELQSHLKSNTLLLKTLTQNYQNYQKELLPLIQKSYALGETSVIEYLMNRQKAYQLREEIVATKKAYYTTLFKLYTLIEKKETK